MRLGRLALARGTLDRAAHRRRDADWLARAWADMRTRVLVVDGGRALVRFTGVGGPHRAAEPGWPGAEPADGDGAEGCELVLVPPAQAPDGPQILLGVDADDVAYFAVIAPLPDAPEGRTTPTGRALPGFGPPQRDAMRAGGAVPVPGRGATPGGVSAAGVVRVGLRQIGALLGDRDAGLLTHAVALANWHLTHAHCPRCGAPTTPAAAGHMRVCPADGSEHFPRVDPAVIMLVLDAADRALLARNENWPRNRVSILAGFVEPGESVEQAVVREVREEVGLTVTEPRYLGSQPWPLPQSLMLGFCARAAAGEHPIIVDAEEIAEARWFSRADLAAALAAGEILLPPPVSIAHRIIEAWYGAPLPQGR